jgi:predicted RND superfamily exporter protein
MWNFIVRFILKNRLFILIVLGLLTIFFAYQATKVEMSYELPRMLPSSDSVSIQYNNFKKIFGEDGNVIFVGIQDKNIFNLNEFTDMYDLTTNLKKIEGVEEVVSITKLFNLAKDTINKKFTFTPIVKKRPTSQMEVDSLKAIIFNLPFYDQLMFNKDSSVFLMALTMNKATFDKKGREKIIDDVKTLIDNYGYKHNFKIHYSGLPYIRTVRSQMIEAEIKMFIILALIVSLILLFFVFRSFKAIIIPLIIVCVSVIWAMGVTALLGYQITILTGMIPPLLILIGVENCIFIINKYHLEIRSHGNKTRALSRVIEKMGKLTLMTNATTASGFITFVFTSSVILFEFGIVSSINIMLTYLLSILLIPILFSYLAPPKPKHLKHLDDRLMLGAVKKIISLIINRRKVIYITSAILVIIGIWGFTKLTTTGNIVDDLPKSDPIYKDLAFFENNFKGVLPFEISIKNEKNGVMNLATFKKIDQLQNVILTYPELSRPLSIVEVVKSARQAFYNGDSAMYELPSNNDFGFIASYMPKNKGNSKIKLLDNFIDSTRKTTRISVQMKNIGTIDIKRIKNEIQVKADTIFNKSKFDVFITGTSVVFLKGTEYLAQNLIISIVIAIIIISLLTALLFSSARMVIIILITNLFPQLLTAALMGFFQIPLKPSTLLIFSIAYGMSVDNAINYMLRYRFEIRKHKLSIQESVINALKDRGSSMLSSSIVLFLGFSIFIASDFGGTVALGLLVSFTLFVAMFANIIILPSLILSIVKPGSTKSIEKPLFEVIEDDNDDD